MLRDGPSVAINTARAALKRAKVIDATGLRRIDQDGWASRVFQQSVTLSEAYDELEHILSELVQSAWFRHIRVLLKMYAIAWITLSDVVANMVNQALSLGYNEKGIEFGAILRDSRAIQIGLPDLVKRHAKALRHDYYARVRNDVVHRGRLHDIELDDVENLWRAVLLTKAFDDTPHAENPDETAEAANTEPAVHVATRSLVAAKAAELRNHLTATRAFLMELDELLAGIIATRL